ncbi:kinesin-like protein KIN-5B [Cynara cardunculus var. scolymus]|uniref:kinesin-like protein KIN-5B n=1 Tax=Cynara cardunculus var. scolymus TaxID=59895 RepID=UPI000D62600B|nr:kinesin-like protein KIN-5B [Cynara cardunculus var. scolymus]
MSSKPTLLDQEQQQAQSMVRMKSCGLSHGSPVIDCDDELSRSALFAFRAKEEEITQKKMAVKQKVEAQLGRVEQETKKLVEIRNGLEALEDPSWKEAAIVRKKVDSVNKELKSLGQNCHKKEKEYREAVEAFNDKNKEKGQLVTRLMELVTESERMRTKKLEDISKQIESFVKI